MKTLLLVTPVFRRLILTKLMLEQRVKTFEAAEKLGVECQCICVGDPENVELARSLGFIGVEAPNVLGAKYNDGHEWAVKHNYDVSFHCNSDQVFDPQLLVQLAHAPQDKLIRTVWLCAVHASGKKSITYSDRKYWAMKAYPHKLLKNAPRPCQEDLMSLCDTSTHEGVFLANPGVETHTVEVSPVETIQFESGFQLTPWKNNFYRGLNDGRVEQEPPWAEIGGLHGNDFLAKMKEFYGV